MCSEPGPQKALHTVLFFLESLPLRKIKPMSAQERMREYVGKAPAAQAINDQPLTHQLAPKPRSKLSRDPLSPSQSSRTAQLLGTLAGHRKGKAP